MKKIVITAFLVVSVFSSCISSVHAFDAGLFYTIVKDMINLCTETVSEGEDEWVIAHNRINTIWQNFSNVSSMHKCYVSYDALSGYVLHKNRVIALMHGEIKGAAVI